MSTDYAPSKRRFNPNIAAYPVFSSFYLVKWLRMHKRPWQWLSEECSTAVSWAFRRVFYMRKLFRSWWNNSSGISDTLRPWLNNGIVIHTVGGKLDQSMYIGPVHIWSFVWIDFWKGLKYSKEFRNKVTHVRVVLYSVIVWCLRNIMIPIQMQSCPPVYLGDDPLKMP